MKILFLASRIPYPPDRGDRVRAWHILEALSADHEVHLAFFSDRRSSRDEMEALRRVSARVEEVHLPRGGSLLKAARGIVSSEPLQVHYYRDRRMSSRVRRLAEENSYDLVYSHLFRVYPFARLVNGVFQLVDLTDVVSREVLDSVPFRPPLMRLVYGVEGARIERFERFVCDTADETWVISEGEREVLQARGIASRVRVVPNGLDPWLLDSPPPSPEAGRMAFLGHLEVFHNVDGLRHFGRRILPRIRREVDGAVLAIAGRGMSPAVKALGRVEGVRLEGFVEDLVGFYRRAAVFVAPLRFAAGTQNKVIQAMAAGVPCLVSPEVARGIGAEPGAEILVAESDDEWVRLAVRVLSHRDWSSRIGEAGRRFARARFSWECARERMRRIEEGIRR